MDGYITIGPIDIPNAKLATLNLLNQTVPTVRGYLYSDGILYANVDSLTQEEINTIIDAVNNLYIGT